jgi:hypothetical protein
MYTQPNRVAVSHQRCAVPPLIISISRRSDIPRFKFDWFLERMKEGFVDVANPFNAAQVRRVSLKPEDAEFLVFWTRDPKALLNAPDVLETYSFYIMTTLTGYPKILEPNVPPQDDVINTMKALSTRYGKSKVIWRYDPILLTSITDTAFHIRNFQELAGRLSSALERVIISIYDEYSGAKRRLNDLEKEGHLALLPHYDKDGHLLPEIKELVFHLAKIAKDAGIEMQSCAEEGLSETDGQSAIIKTGACIDGELIRKIMGERKTLPELDGRDKNQRPNCHCVPSVDIGSYGSCPAACVYCYARR